MSRPEAPGAVAYARLIEMRRELIAKLDRAIDGGMIALLGSVAARAQCDRRGGGRGKAKSERSAGYRVTRAPGANARSSRRIAIAACLQDRSHARPRR